MEQREREDLVEIAAEDADLVALFFALDTQWNVHAMTGQRLGLSYSAIAPTADLLGMAVTPAMMHDLRVMEMAALAEFGAQAARAARSRR